MEHLLSSDPLLLTGGTTCQLVPAFEKEAGRKLFAARQLYYKFDECNERWSPCNNCLTWFPDAVIYQLNQLNTIIKKGTIVQRAEAKVLHGWYLPFYFNIKSKLVANTNLLGNKNHTL